ncbi:CobQ/CobB/MinD/ParA nucleotide binding domain protein [Labrenzia sp. THAF82]|uniref:nucleotide-binding protein n=1 Tax=Labrenzia sp. THAF82 TaxID=2587861 RepID=UPI0012686BAE|nr:conjugal transfer protein TraL [Labrenzia sp. THAF82]QFT29591.1 CobQ/CobB/MinD/ParA nucleotide binding domain protein [Labrenzia sp. THAF82]
MVNTVHFVMQGKGGAGKSLTSSMLVQYLRHKDRPVQAFDLDPATPTLSAISALGARKIDIMAGDDIDPRRFDAVIEGIFEAAEGGHTVIDTGTSSFIATCSYLLENSAFELLEGSGVRVYLHCPLCGGAALDDTFNSLLAMARNFPGVPLVVWLNEFFGPVAKNGKPFEESGLCQENAGRIAAIMRHPKVQAGTFGEDIRTMMAANLTFVEAIGSPDFNLMARQRLKIYWQQAIDRFDQAAFLKEPAAEPAAAPVIEAAQ